MTDGFIMVATCKYVYYQSACFAAESLRDYYPDANITLFTHHEWVDNQADVFDNVVTDDVPASPRAKLWALSRSPYTRTMYVDADSEVASEDIKTAHDQIGSNDIVLARIRPYAAAITRFPGGELTLHCGMFAYQKSEILYQLFDEWFLTWETQQRHWDIDSELYPPDLLRPWDIFSFWRLLKLEGWENKIKIGIWEDDARWNFHGFHRSELNGQDPIIIHHTLQDFTHEKNKSREYYGT